MGSGKMQPVLLTVIGVIAYIFGLLIIITVTPRLLKLNFDEGLFMGIAAADVFGGILAFAPVGITFALFNGRFGIKILDFLLLVGILIVGLRMSLRSFRPRYPAGTFQVSRILAGRQCLFVLGACLLGFCVLFLWSEFESL